MGDNCDDGTVRSAPCNDMKNIFDEEKQPEELRHKIFHTCNEFFENPLVSIRMNASLARTLKSTKDDPYDAITRAWGAAQYKGDRQCSRYKHEEDCIRDSAECGGHRERFLRVEDQAAHSPYLKVSLGHTDGSSKPEADSPVKYFKQESQIADAARERQLDIKMKGSVVVSFWWKPPGMDMSCELGHSDLQYYAT